MPIVNYAKEYRMFRLLIGISLLCSHHWCQLAAAKKTRVQADNLGFRPTIWENIFFYKFLGGVFSGISLSIQGYPHGIFWRLHVLYQQCLQCCFLMVYVPAICLWCCKLLSFCCIWVINFVLYIWLQKYIWVQKYIL